MFPTEPRVPEELGEVDGPNRRIPEENISRIRQDPIRASSRVVRFSCDDEDFSRLATNIQDRQGSVEDDKKTSRRQKRGHLEHPDQDHWLKRWAYSFRSPAVGKTKHFEGRGGHHRHQSSALQEYPYCNSALDSSSSLETRLPPPPPPADECSPLLATSYSTPLAMDTGSWEFRKSKTLEPWHTSDPGGRSNRNLSVTVAAIFLQDYENSRPPTFASAELNAINDHQIVMYTVKHSFAMSFLRLTATMALFISSFMESSQNSIESGDARYNRCFAMTSMNGFAITVFCIDMWMHRVLRNADAIQNTPNDGNHIQKERTESTLEFQLKHDVRLSRSRRLIMPLVVFFVIFGLENTLRLVFSGNDHAVFVSSIFKPLVLFYISSRARDALEAVGWILKIVTRVIFVELFLILMFAAVACRLFHEFENFRDLYKAWISLYELSTTVVNPSIWMPAYEASQFSAIFFVLFIVTSVFYMHSLVLSVVFQTYIHAAAEIHDRNAADREDAVYLAFMALRQVGRNIELGTDARVETYRIRQTLQLLRPHYSSMKIGALLEIMDPSHQGFVDYATFRTKIRPALNASIRTPRNTSSFAMFVELVAVLVAILNFAYVILYSSPFDEDWFNGIQAMAGTAITVVAAFELFARFNPFHIRGFTPLTRLNATFDGLALVAALISCIGIMMLVGGHPLAVEYILMGRAVDMIRVMRFFQTFRDVVRRSSDVIPALAGPFILLVTTLHVFVYMGIAIWGGAVEVGKHDGEITKLYDLNNFNSYHEGFVTMFQVLVVNDWHAIAQVYFYASKCTSPIIVYSFFIVAQLIGVSIMLNVMTAFFVESFATQMDHDKDGPAEATAKVPRERDFVIKTSERGVRRMSSRSNLSRIHQEDSVNDSISSYHSEELTEFDVYEREGFDTIMQMIAGAEHGEDFARVICNYFEVFEWLSPAREEPIGYLLCDQQTLERFGNKRFRKKAEGFLEETKLHAVVTSMHSELLSRASPESTRQNSLVRSFPHMKDPSKLLEISASLLRRQPGLSLFVSRTVLLPHEGNEPPSSEPSTSKGKMPADHF